MVQRLRSTGAPGQMISLVDTRGSIIDFTSNEAGQVALPVDTEITLVAGTVIANVYSNSAGTMAAALIDSSRRIIVSPTSTIVVSPSGTQDIRIAINASTLTTRLVDSAGSAITFVLNNDGDIAIPVDTEIVVSGTLEANVFSDAAGAYAAALIDSSRRIILSPSGTVTTYGFANTTGTTALIDASNRIILSPSGTVTAYAFANTSGTTALVDSTNRIILSPQSTVVVSPSGTQDVNIVGSTSTVQTDGFATGAGARTAALIDSSNRIILSPSGTVTTYGFANTTGTTALIDASNRIILSPSGTVTAYTFANTTGTTALIDASNRIILSPSGTVTTYGFANTSGTTALIDASNRIILSPSSTVTITTSGTVIAQSPELLATTVNHILSDVSTTSTLLTTSLTTVYGSMIKNIGSNPVYVTWGTGAVTASTLQMKLLAGESITQSPYAFSRYAGICDTGQTSTVCIAFNGL